MSASQTPEFNQLMDQARVKLIGSSDAGIKGELFYVYSEFFKDSSAWTEKLTVSMLPNEVDYDVVPTDGQIIRLAGVVDANGRPVPALMTDYGHIVFRDPPNVAQNAYVTVVKNVVLPNLRDNTPVVPDFTLRVYGVTILDGLIGRMMTQPNKSYTNDALGTYHLRRFRDGIAQARTDALHRNTMGAQSWAFPQSFRASSQRGGVSTGNQSGF